MHIRRDSNKISEIFTAVQYNRTCHANNIKKLKKCFDKMEFQDFVEEFISNLRIPMTYIEKHPHVENCLKFAASFCISLQPQPEPEKEDEDLDEMCPFLEQIFEFLLQHHGAKEVAVRFRVCYFLNMILDTMGDNATIDDDLCNRILQCMMERIIDKSPKVRAQAAIALYRLQEPNNKNCPVINVYLFHLAKDPSPEVRRVILAKMAKNKTTLHAAIKRTMDVDDSVRKMAYLFISKITVKSLTISQREKLINHGLKDSSENIKKCIREILIPSWLRYYDKNYISLLKAIDAEHSAETAILALQCLFKNADIGNLIEQLPLNNTKSIPLSELSSEVVLYWRCLAEFLKNENCTEELEQIIPELTPFCSYIRDFIKPIDTRQNQVHEVFTQQFILHQLFEMVKLYDLADEVGRKNLKELILETLQTHSCTEKISDCIVTYLETVIPDLNARISSLVEVISEIRMPIKTNVIVPMTEDERHERKMERAKLAMKLLELEDEEYSAIQQKNYELAGKINEKAAAVKEKMNNLSKEPEQPEPQSQNLCEEKSDPETMIQCLQIMYFMMRSPTVQVLSPTLRTVLDSISLPFMSMQNTNEAVLSLAIKCTGLCCHVDKDLAKKYLFVFFLYISEFANEEVWVSAAEVIFDLLLKYGFDHFDIAQEDNAEENASKRHKSVRLYSHNDEDTNVTDEQINRTDSSNKVITALMALLDSQVHSLQSVAVEGLAKLILHKRINSHLLLSQLIILWHNPAAKENTFLSQCLCSFFNIYINKVPEGSTLLGEAYLPTLKSLVNAPDMSSLHEIDPLRVSEVIISLTCHGITNSYAVHNQLTNIILNEIMNTDTDIPMDVLVKSLKMLDVQFDEGEEKTDILKTLDRADEMLSDLSEKRLQQILAQFRSKVTAPRPEETIESQGPENQENNQTAESQAEQIPMSVDETVENTRRSSESTEKQGEQQDESIEE